MAQKQPFPPQPTRAVFAESHRVEGWELEARSPGGVPSALRVALSRIGRVVLTQTYCAERLVRIFVSGSQKKQHAPFALVAPLGNRKDV